MIYNKEFWDNYSNENELRYNEELKCVEYQPVKLMQEYRFFDFESPWNQYLINTSINKN